MLEKHDEDNSYYVICDYVENSSKEIRGTEINCHYCNRELYISNSSFIAAAGHELRAICPKCVISNNLLEEEPYIAPTEGQLRELNEHGIPEEYVEFLKNKDAALAAVRSLIKRGEKSDDKSFKSGLA